MDIANTQRDSNGSECRQASGERAPSNDVAQVRNAIGYRRSDEHDLQLGAYSERSVRAGYRMKQYRSRCRMHLNNVNKRWRSDKRCATAGRNANVAIRCKDNVIAAVAMVAIDLFGGFPRRGRLSVNMVGFVPINRCNNYLIEGMVLQTTAAARVQIVNQRYKQQHAKTSN